MSHCPPCNHDCKQSDTCPARQPAAKPVPEATQGFDPIPELSNWERIAYWMAIGIVSTCTLGVAAGAMGFAYSKWVA